MGRKTKDAMKSHPTKPHPEEKDPWLEKDPWQTPPKVARVMTTAPTKMDIQQEVEKQIQTALKAQGDYHQKHPQQGEESRLEALEKKVGTLEKGLATQQQHTSKISEQIANVQQQVASHAIQAQQQLDQRFAEQLAQIDALLNKRGRHE